MQNLEFKTRLDDPAKTAAVLTALRATDAGLLVQRDTYFRVADGRLKLREMPDHAELIAYNRDERDGAMLSHYTVTPVADPAALRAELAARHGIRGVVEKTRGLWLYRNARIHLDHIAGLGSFLEIEVVEPRTLEDGRARLEELLTALRLHHAEPLRMSYVDLVEAAAPR
ncbi:MAG: class IV adenylate cyclase [Dehalococcoidia bacterium]